MERFPSTELWPAACLNGSIGEMDLVPSLMLGTSAPTPVPASAAAPTANAGFAALLLPLAGEQANDASPSQPASTTQAALPTLPSAAESAGSSLQAKPRVAAGPKPEEKHTATKDGAKQDNPMDSTSLLAFVPAPLQVPVPVQVSVHGPASARNPVPAIQAGSNGSSSPNPKQNIRITPADPGPRPASAVVGTFAGDRVQSPQPPAAGAESIISNLGALSQR